MTLDELLEHLVKIKEVHPEVGEFAVWADSADFGNRFQIKSVGLDRRHKPPRIKLED